MLRKQKSIDSFCRTTRKDCFVDWPLAKHIKKHKGASVLFFKYGRTEKFSTETLHIHHIKSKKQPNFQSLDGFLSFEKKISVRYASRHRFEILSFIKEEYGSLRNYLKNALNGPIADMSMVKMWNASIVTALFFGMFIMTFLYRYLGQNAAADSAPESSPSAAQISQVDSGEVLGLAAFSTDERKADDDHVSKVMDEYQEKKDNHDKSSEKIQAMVKGYPIEKMAPFIAQQDKTVAAFLVAIAKKESNWGKRVPVLDGKDCYNYWGYRGIREKMGTGGHTCFDSPEDAVKTVAKRLAYLVEEEDMTTPKKMVVVWKCGYDCSWDEPAAVKKWVSDVTPYFKELL